RAGSVLIDAQGAVTLEKDITAQDVTVDAGGSILIGGLLDATNFVTLSSAGGAILDGNGGALNVVTPDLTVSAATGVTLDTDVSSLTATVTAGNLTIHEVDNGDDGLLIDA